MYYTTIDLHTTRSLQSHSSVLGSYDTLSKLNMDTIIEKSVRADYNELIFDSSMAGFDYLDVSRRPFQRIDFRITDSFGKNSKFEQLALVFFGDVSETLSSSVNIPGDQHGSPAIRSY